MEVNRTQADQRSKTQEAVVRVKTRHSGTPGTGAAASASDGGGVRVLPRGEALVLGGDLAYPNPSNETYETRLVRPFEAAMPPPPVRSPCAAKLPS